MNKKIITIITVLSIVFGGIISFWVSYNSSMKPQQLSFKWQQQKLRNDMGIQRSKDTFHTTPMVGYSNDD